MVDPQSVKRRLTCILAADAVGYSRQMGQDEEGTIRVLSAHRSVIDGLIAFHGGRIMSTAGDSVLAEFASAVEAVRCAVEIQEALKTSNEALPANTRMDFRVGVNLGDVVVKDEDLLGDGVNVAARLETLAEPGGICISSSVYDQITGKLDLRFQDIGEQALKNISRPIRVYRVSGTGLPRPAPRASRAQRMGKSFPWGIGVALVVATAAIAAWQAGWLHFGANERGGPTGATGPVVAPASPAPAPSAAVASAPAAASGPSAAVASGPAASTAPASQIDAETQRLRADGGALKKKQAEAEPARARTDADAMRAAKSRADAETAANRLRAQAADAARIRREAQAAATRAKSDAEAVARDAESKAAKVAIAPASAAASEVRYDGTWSVTVSCTPSEGAASYKIEFEAQVKNNFLRGERGVEGKPNWLKLQGAIQPDGSATLNAQGTTGDPKYNVKGIGEGLPYAYPVAARFDSNRGTGRRLESRPCDLHFAKR